MINHSCSATRLLIKDLEASSLTKLVLISLECSFIPKFLLLICFLYSQLQIFGVLAKTVLLIISNDFENITIILERIHQVSSIADLFTLETYSSMQTALSLIVAYKFIIILCAIYLLMNIQKQQIPHIIGQKIWNIFLSTHSLIISYPIHYTTLLVISNTASNNDVTTGNSISSAGLKIMSIVILVVNIIFSIGIVLFTRANVKTQSILSMKTRYTEMTDLSIKILSPIIWFCTSNANVLQILILTGSFIWIVIKDIVFFRYLPYYDLSILKLCNKIYAANSSFTLVIIITSLKALTRFQSNMGFLIFFWIISFPFLINLYNKVLQSILRDIVLKISQNTNPYHLLHYWKVYKDLSKKSVKPRLRVRSIKEAQLYYNVILKHSNFVPEEKTKEKIKTNLDLDLENISNKYFFDLMKDLLKDAIIKHPDLWVLKAALATRYVKYKGLSILADHLISEGLKCISLSPKTPTLYYAKLQLLKKIKISESQSHKEDEEGQVDERLNVEKYIKLYELYKKIKMTILKQLEPQINFWKEFQTNEPELAHLVSLASEAHNNAKRISKYWQDYNLFVEAGYLKPLLIYGFYCALARNKFEDGLKILQEFFHFESKTKQTKIEQFQTFQNEAFVFNSLYFIVSGAQKQLGKVLDCSGDILNVLGIHKEMLVGKNIGTIMPPFYAQKHDNLIRASYTKNEFKALDQSRERQVRDHKGYLVTCHVYITLNFLPEFGLCYYGLLKTVNNKKRTIFIDERGVITNFSENFAQDMNIKRADTLLDVSIICPDLEEALQGFIPQNHHTHRTKTSTMRFRNFNKANSRFTHLFSTVSRDGRKRTRLLSEKMTETISRFQKSAEGHLLGFNVMFHPLFASKSFNTMRSGVEGGFLIYNITIQLNTYEGESIAECRMEKVANVSQGGFSSFINSMAVIKNLKLLKDKKSRNYGTKESLNLASMTSFELAKTKTIQTPAVTPDIERSKRQPRKSIFRPRGGETPGNEDGSDISMQASNFETKNSMVRDLNATFAEENISPVRGQGQGQQTEILSPTSFIDEDAMRELRRTSYELGGLRDTLLIPHGDSDYVDEFSRGSQMVKSVVNSYEPLKESSLEKTSKLKIIEESLIKEILGEEFTEDHKNAGVGKTKAIGIQRVIEKVLKSDKHTKSAKYYYILFIMSIIVQVGFMAWLTMYISQTCSNLQNLGGAIQGVYLRDYWMKLVNQETRLWYAATEGLGTDSSIFNLTRLTSRSKHALDQASGYNQDLRRIIGDIPSDVQPLFYRKDIDVYDRDINNKLVFLSKDEVIQLAERIVNSGSDNIYSTEGVSVNRNSRFIFDNSFNDLLVSSENVISLLTDSLTSSFKTTKNIMIIVLVSTLSALLVFVAFSVRFMLKITKKYLRFMKTLFTVSPREAIKSEAVLNVFKDLIERDSSNSEFISKLSESNINIHIKRSQSTGLFSDRDKKGNRRVVRQASMKKIYLQNRIIFIVLFLAILITVAFLIVYFDQALNKLNATKDQENRLASILKLVNVQAFINVELQALVMDNATTTIRNIPILTNLETDLAIFKNINAFQDSLLDDSELILSNKQQALFNTNCTKVYSSQYLNTYEESVSQCLALSKGLGHIGLVDLLPGMVNTIDTITSQFEQGVKDESTLIILYNQAVEMMNELTDVGVTLLLMLFEITKLDAADAIKKTDYKNLVMMLAALLVSIIVGFLSWMFVIKTLVNQELERRYTLELIPNRVIVNNPYMRKYLFDISNGKFDEIKHFL